MSAILDQHGNPLEPTSGILIPVFLNDRKGRRRVDGELLKRNKRSVLVKLDDGSVVKRKLGRDY